MLQKSRLIENMFDLVEGHGELVERSGPLLNLLATENVLAESTLLQSIWKTAFASEKLGPGHDHISRPAMEILYKVCYRLHPSKLQILIEKIREDLHLTITKDFSENLGMKSFGNQGIEKNRKDAVQRALLRRKYFCMNKSSESSEQMTPSYLRMVRVIGLRCKHILDMYANYAVGKYSIKRSNSRPRIISDAQDVYMECFDLLWMTTFTVNDQHSGNIQEEACQTLEMLLLDTPCGKNLILSDDTKEVDKYEEEINLERGKISESSMISPDDVMQEESAR